MLAVGPFRRETAAMFTPKWKNEAKHLVKGARKFVDYKRDLLKPERVLEIESRRTDLLEAIKTRDLGKVNEASKQLRAVCENSLPHDPPLGWLEENVEVMFVAIVIALGLRAYYLQPFRIPTGSMQPTLNGIVGRPMKQEEWPGLPQRLLEMVLRGRSYEKVVAKNDMRLRIAYGSDGRYRTELEDSQFLHFFSRSTLRTVNGETIRMPAPSTSIYDIGLSETLGKAASNGGLIPAGTVLCEGKIDTGDLVLVDKFSYHFRKPKRGEVFVFNTIDIDGILKRSGPQGAGSHYIKRLCGVPGDTLSVQPPNVLIDGKIAREPGIQRVAAGQGPYHINPNGYSFASPNEGSHNGKRLPQYISKPSDTFTLSDTKRVGMREYAALGDNSGNSLDSRYWGAVKEFNLVGPALFSLWPFTTGHWGLIN
jgi:signal peptidase I